MLPKFEPAHEPEAVGVWEVEPLTDAARVVPILRVGSMTPARPTDPTAPVYDPNVTQLAHGIRFSYRDGRELTYSWSGLLRVEYVPFGLDATVTAAPS